MKKTCILLSTYNGEKYLDELLNSLLATTVEFDLIVRDDGSIDNSISIVKRIIPNCHIIENSGTHLGVNNSYGLLLEKAESYDHIFFCDQDDVWHQDKLKTMLGHIRNKENPVLVFSNSIVSNKIEQNLDKLSIEFKINAIFENPARGCTQLINQSMRNLIINNPAPDGILFDHWNYFLASHFGEVIYEKKALLFYRLHESNDIGIRHLSDLIMDIRNIKKNINIYRKRTLSLINKHLELEYENRIAVDFFITKILKDHNRLRLKTLDNLIVNLFLLFGWVR